MVELGGAVVCWAGGRFVVPDRSGSLGFGGIETAGEYVPISPIVSEDDRGIAVLAGDKLRGFLNTGERIQDGGAVYHQNWLVREDHFVLDASGKHTSNDVAFLVPVRAGGG